MAAAFALLAVGPGVNSTASAQQAPQYAQQPQQTQPQQQAQQQFNVAQINQLVAPIALYPDPNLPGEINNFLYNPVQKNRVDQFNIRSDYRTSRSAIGRIRSTG